jgi:hypothetical protein
VTNPPFKVTISGGEKTKIKNEKSFEHINANTLKDHSWSDTVNIKEFELAFTNVGDGFVGSAVIAVLEKRGRPVSTIKMKSRTVKIDNDKYALAKTMIMSDDSIKVESSHITVDDDGDVRQSSSSTEVAESKSRISLHGIEVPTTLFPDYWERRQNPVRLDWPFPALLILDVCGKADLDLNSSRTQILQTQKWATFEETLTSAICTQIAQRVSAKYWKTLSAVLKQLSDNPLFLRCLKNASLHEDARRS